jgi:probable phosphoglycerate mutase
VGKTILCLVRHGETAWNAQRRIQGHIDVALNAKGIEQARRAAEGLKDETFAAIYSSDLKRARDTAHTLAQALRLPVRLRPELRERHYGMFEALTYDEARRRHPEAYGRFEARDPDFDFSGGESLKAFAQRVTDCLEALVRQHGGRRILAVTHGGVLDIVFRHATGRALTAPRDFDIPNAACNWLEYAAGVWSVLRWADRRHLSDTLDELPA